MTTQLLIYETVVPVMFANHRHSSVEFGRNYAFSRRINSVPLTAIEFRDAQSDYPIVFAGNKEGVMPAVILGLREGENLYLSADGKWMHDTFRLLFAAIPSYSPRATTVRDSICASMKCFRASMEMGAASGYSPTTASPPLTWKIS